MWRGFKLNFDTNKLGNYAEYYEKAIAKYNDDTKQVKSVLEDFLLSDNTLDGSAIQDFWFPRIKADVFISHSHKDKDQAIALAGWLFHNFKLSTFIDSCIWGHSNELLLTLDKKYCWMSDRDVYDYNLRNQTTSHVHMMLSTALAMMIDKTECLFFLNTPNSIKAFNTEERTLFPWIYSEIATSQIVRKRNPRGKLNEQFSNYTGYLEIKKSVDISYTLDLNHLTSLSLEDFNYWLRAKQPNEHALDTLYSLNRPKEISNLLNK